MFSYPYDALIVIFFLFFVRWAVGPACFPFPYFMNCLCMYFWSWFPSNISLKMFMLMKYIHRFIYHLVLFVYWCYRVFSSGAKFVGVFVELWCGCFYCITFVFIHLAV